MYYKNTDVYIYILAIMYDALEYVYYIVLKYKWSAFVRQSLALHALFCFARRSPSLSVCCRGMCR